MSEGVKNKKLHIAIGSLNTIVVGSSEPRKKIRMSLFFDGTLNNRNNTDIGADNAPEPGRLEGVGSYENDYSNVSKLEKHLNGDSRYDYDHKVYIEGIGTEDGQADSQMPGAALGMGSTGVKAKVYKGVEQVRRSIEAWTLDSNVTEIETLHLDAFGFSRGAAAARYFCHVVLKDEEKNIKSLALSFGVEIHTVEIKFVGLFDTVASHGVVHSDDTEDLKLDAVSDALKVVHLAAAEEHRKNFRLTDIRSVFGPQGRGKAVSYEIYLPGVHSDVGGGYVNNSSENDLTLLEFSAFSSLFRGDTIDARIRKEKERLVQSGWYKADDIKDFHRNNREVVVSRSNILNAYSFIPLAIMADFIRGDQLKVKSRLNLDYSIPEGLRAMESRLRNYVNDIKALQNGQASEIEDWLEENDEDLMELRHKYLHSSAYYGGSFGSMDPQFSDNDPLKGVRQRVVQSG